MREEGFLGRTITVKLRFADFETHTHGRTLMHGTDDPALIRQTALECLEWFPLRKKVRLIGLRVDGLEKR